MPLCHFRTTHTVHTLKTVHVPAPSHRCVDPFLLPRKVQDTGLTTYDTFISTKWHKKPRKALERGWIYCAKKCYTKFCRTRTETDCVQLQQVECCTTIKCRSAAVYHHVQDHTVQCLTTIPMVRCMVTQ